MEGWLADSLVLTQILTGKPELATGKELLRDLIYRMDKCACIPCTCALGYTRQSAELETEFQQCTLPRTMAQSSYKELGIPSRSAPQHE